MCVYGSAHEIFHKHSQTQVTSPIWQKARPNGFKNQRVSCKLYTALYQAMQHQPQTHPHRCGRRASNNESVHSHLHAGTNWTFRTPEIRYSWAKVGNLQIHRNVVYHGVPNFDPKSSTRRGQIYANSSLKVTLKIRLEPFHRIFQVCNNTPAAAVAAVAPQQYLWVQASAFGLGAEPCWRPCASNFHQMKLMGLRCTHLKWPFNRTIDEKACDVGRPWATLLSDNPIGSHDDWSYSHTEMDENS